MQTASIPMAHIGPIKIVDTDFTDEVEVPLATYETPLWPSTNRGAKISKLTDGIKTTIVNDRMSRSILLEAPTAGEANQAVHDIIARVPDLAEVVQQSSRFAVLLDVNHQVIGNLIFLRLEFKTGDASGHNMVTNGAQTAIEWLLQQYPNLSYVSISGNYCTDKKVSCVNGILGRGKHVVAEMMIPHEIVEKHLHTTAEKIAELNVKKNLIGSIAAGGLRTANAHFANILLGFYLATGQDAANIVEGSQGIVHTEVKPEGLYFSVTIPNIIVGTVGSGKEHGFVKDNLAKMGCLDEDKPGRNARRLASICAATILCGELSLMAALTNPGELMRSHIAIERKGSVRYRT